MYFASATEINREKRYSSKTGTLIKNRVTQNLTQGNTVAQTVERWDRTHQIMGSSPGHDGKVFLCSATWALFSTGEKKALNTGFKNSFLRGVMKKKSWTIKRFFSHLLHVNFSRLFSFPGVLLGILTYHNRWIAERVVQTVCRCKHVSFAYDGTSTRYVTCFVIFVFVSSDLHVKFSVRGVVSVDDCPVRLVRFNHFVVSHNRIDA